jgi:hypothetical protein
MTLTHKIKLVFSRIGWWLRITEKSKDHYEALQDYYYLYDLYNTILVAYLETHRKQKDQKLINELNGHRKLLSRILDIN